LKKRVWFPILVFLLLIPLAACSGTTNQTKQPPSTTPIPPAAQAEQQLSLKITEPADESVVKSDAINLSGSVSTTAEITINGASVAVENGNFTATVELEEGPNSLEVRASDGKGHEEVKVLTIVYLP
jgi:hypothetical protein